MPMTTRRRWRGASSFLKSTEGALLTLCLFAAWSVCLAAQTPPAAPRMPIPAALHPEVSAQPTTFAFFNRPILTLRARVLGIDAAKFQELAAGAKANCPVSKVLNAEITLDAKLE